MIRVFEFLRMNINALIIMRLVLLIWWNWSSRDINDSMFRVCMIWFEFLTIEMRFAFSANLEFWIFYKYFCFDFRWCHFYQRKYRFLWKKTIFVLFCRWYCWCWCNCCCEYRCVHFDRWFDQYYDEFCLNIIFEFYWKRDFEIET